MIASSLYQKTLWDDIWCWDEVRGRGRCRPLSFKWLPLFLGWYGVAIYWREYAWVLIEILITMRNTEYFISTMSNAPISTNKICRLIVIILPSWPSGLLDNCVPPFLKRFRFCDLKLLVITAKGRTRGRKCRHTYVTQCRMPVLRQYFSFWATTQLFELWWASECRFRRQISTHFIIHITTFDIMLIKFGKRAELVTTEWR